MEEFMMNTIFERRSVNHFDETKKLEGTLLKTIIDQARLAPSAFNLQPWEIIAVTSDEGKQKLFELSNQQPKVLKAPVTLIIIGKRDGYLPDQAAWKPLEAAMGDHVQGAKDAAMYLYGSSEERKVKFAESNAGLLAMSIMYAAKDHGVDSHPMSGIDFQGIKEAFSISANSEVVMTIALGYRDENETLYDQGPRLAYDDLVRTV